MTLEVLPQINYRKTVTMKTNEIVITKIEKKSIKVKSAMA